MTSPTTRVLDEVAKMLSSAAGAAQGVRDEIDSLIRSQLDRLVNDMQLVRREEFDVVKEMARKARLEAEELKARVATLEKKLAAKKKTPKKGA